MSGAFVDSFGTGVHSPTVPPASTTRSFDDDGYLGYDPRLPSQGFDSFSPEDDEDSLIKDDAVPPIFASPSPYVDDGSFPPPSSIPQTPSPRPIYATTGGFSPDPHGHGAFASSEGPILPPPAEMGPPKKALYSENGDDKMFYSYKKRKGGRKSWRTRSGRKLKSTKLISRGGENLTMKLIKPIAGKMRSSF